METIFKIKELKFKVTRCSNDSLIHKYSLTFHWLQLSSAERVHGGGGVFVLTLLGAVRC